MKISVSKVHIATFIALLFHVSGCLGMFTSRRDWFIANTPLNLVITFVLLVWTQREKNTAFFAFVALAFATGMITEMVGVNTGVLFGHYQYGKVLGLQVNKVPLLIGITWFTVVYCSGVLVQTFHNWLMTRNEDATQALSPGLLFFSTVVDAALLATFFDWVMEPVAVQLGYWWWLSDEIPFKNYFCWFVISALLLVAFRLLRFDKHNQFAVHLLLIQLLFFGVLRTFL